MIAITDSEREAEAMAAALAELVLDGLLSEDEYHAVVECWKCRDKMTPPRF